MGQAGQILPIYTTNGEVRALYSPPFLYDCQGEWIGWVTSERDVYSVHGNYVGKLNNDARITRPRTYDYSNPQVEPPTDVPHISPPAHFPLPPMLPDLTYNLVDVLEEAPDLLPTSDCDDLRQDMD